MVRELKDNLVAWIRDFFEENGKGCNAIIGISGGKDSSVAAALCVEALGVDRVIGVLMPNGEQSDISFSHDLVKHLGIKYHVVNIGGITSAFFKEEEFSKMNSTQTKINLPARVRMTVLYGVSQSLNGRVVNTCNLSEDWVGYSTRYGDAAGDFSPLSDLTSSEVVELGKFLGLPEHLTSKVPTDGLCGKTDEDNLGFTYEVLDKYIRTGVCEDAIIKARIDDMHVKNLFKMSMMPNFKSGIQIIAG